MDSVRFDGMTSVSTVFRSSDDDSYSTMTEEEEEDPISYPAFQVTVDVVLRDAEGRQLVKFTLRDIVLESYDEESVTFGGSDRSARLFFDFGGILVGGKNSVPQWSIGETLDNGKGGLVKLLSIFPCSIVH